MMDFLDPIGILDAGMDVWKQDKAEDMQQHSMNFSASQALMNREFQRDMSNTSYQRATADMKAAGLNPMLAYSQGGASTPGGSQAGGGTQGAPPRAATFAASQHSAAQARLADTTVANVQADTDRKKAETAEIAARTETYPISIEKMRQEIQTSVAQAEALLQQARTGASSAAHLDQQVKNLKEMIPQIRETVNHLRSQQNLEWAHANLSNEQKKEIMQRVAANLPSLEAALRTLEANKKHFDMPRVSNDAATHQSWVGALSSIMKALNPLQGLFVK